MAETDQVTVHGNASSREELCALHVTIELTRRKVLARLAGDEEDAAHLGNVISALQSTFPECITDKFLAESSEAFEKIAGWRSSYSSTIEDITETSLSSSEIARVCHDVNAAICLALGDDSQPDWGNADAAILKTTVKLVRRAQAHLDETPEDSHNAWMAAKIADGWEWGISKNTDRKEHPDLIPYEALSPEAKIKDAVFLAIVKALS